MIKLVRIIIDCIEITAIIITHFKNSINTLPHPNPMLSRYSPADFFPFNKPKMVGTIIINKQEYIRICKIKIFKIIIFGEGASSSI